MVCRGTIRNGTLVLDEPLPLRDGTRVEVHLVEESAPASDSFHPVGSWEGPPGELDRLLAEVQEMRDADLTFPERDEDDSVHP